MTTAPNWQEQLEEAGSDLTRNDRFSSLLVMALATIGIVSGLLLRQTTLFSTWRYVNREAGIEASYPAGWLVDERGSYIARLRDASARPYKTQYLITVVPVGSPASVRSALDSLTLQRSVELPAYRVLSVQELVLADRSVTQMEFAFVDTDPNPFIQRLPIVVRGLDRVVLDGGRAIVVTYLAAEASFAENLPDFERFFASFQY